MLSGGIFDKEENYDCSYLLEHKGKYVDGEISKFEDRKKGVKKVEK